MNDERHHRSLSLFHFIFSFYFMMNDEAATSILIC